MTIKVEYNGSIYEEIKIDGAYILGINFSNKSNNQSTVNTVEFRPNKPYAYIERPLPNGASVVFLIIKINDALIEKYKGLTTFMLDYDGINIKATL